MKHFILPVFFLLILTSLHLTAQWAPMSNGIESRIVRSLGVFGNFTFAGTDGYGVYVSNNYGETWTQSVLNSGSVWSLCSGLGSIFSARAMGTAGVNFSTNYGLTWNWANMGSDVLCLASNGNYVFAGTWAFPHPGNYPKGVYVTSSGTNWFQTSLNNRDVYSLAVNGNNIFAGMYSSYGVYRSTDNGANWQQTSLDNLIIPSLAVNGNFVYAGTASGYGVYRSTDNGASWMQTSLSFHTIYSLAVSGSNVFAGTNGSGVFVSSDNGSSWSPRNEGLSNLTVRAICISGDYLFAGTPSSVFRRPIEQLTGVTPVSSEVPYEFLLFQNYPNPFNPVTKIKFDIPSVGQRHAFEIQLVIYDILGIEIATLVNEQLQPGMYEVVWNASNYPSGVYYCKLISPDYTDTRKMILMK